MNVVRTSTQFSLDIRDGLKGLLVAVITPVFTVIINSLEAGSLTFNWKAIAITALTAGLAYVLKNFLTPAKVVVSNASEAVKDAVVETVNETK
ncbi:MAG: hypothetical protein ABIT05_01455 [Chitinophagaceae bacterium]